MFLPLELTLRPSRVQTAVLAAGLALAAGAALLANLPLPVKAALLFLIGLAGWRALQKSPIAALRISQSAEVGVRVGEDWLNAEITGQPVATPWLVHLRLKLENGDKLSLHLWPDSADTNQLRRLRVWLGWGFRQAG